MRTTREGGSKMSVQGIDVSRFQGAVDWRKVNGAGKIFGFAKATQGVSYVDPTFAKNWSAMADAGMIRGAYHFYSAASPASAQAKNFINAIGSLDVGDLPPVIDLEDRSGIVQNQVPVARLRQGVHDWIDAVQDALGLTPIIYTDPSFWKQYMSDEFGEYPLWIANYNVAQPTVPSTWEDYAFWQYSQTGKVSGVAGNVDLNVFNGTQDDLEAMTSGK